MEFLPQIILDLDINKGLRYNWIILTQNQGEVIQNEDARIKNRIMNENEGDYVLLV